jgi:hypothetical protein
MDPMNPLPQYCTLLHTVLHLADIYWTRLGLKKDFKTNIHLCSLFLLTFCGPRILYDLNR